MIQTELPLNDERIEDPGLQGQRAPMKNLIIAFDVDGTLLLEGDVPCVPWINTLQVLSTCKNVKIVVWSGGGEDYARTWGHRLGLDEYVWKYESKVNHKLVSPDIAIDDIHECNLGKLNLIVHNKGNWDGEEPRTA